MSEPSKKPIRLTDYVEFYGFRVSPLAIALAEHSEWRWHEGMVAVTNKMAAEAGFALCENPFQVTCGTIAAGQSPSAWFSDGYEYGEFDVAGKVVPDLFDPGTTGWLQWILHTYEPNAVALPYSPGKPCRVVVVGDDDSFRVLATAPTTGEALARALLLLWGVEVIDGG